MPKRSLVLAVTMMPAFVLGVVRADVPSHPDELTFPPLEFTPPAAEAYRATLSTGVPVYLAPSREFPLVTVTFTFRGGAYLETPEEVGLAAALGSLMRRGGTTTVTAADLDERFDFMAARVGSFAGAEQSGATLDCLGTNFGEAFALFLDMVRNPGFDAERLRVYQDEVIESLKQRNDTPMAVAMRTMRELAFGPDHYLGRQPTLASTEAITPARLRALYARIFHPGNLVISATGDFEPSTMLARLEAALTGWASGPPAGDPPAPTHAVEPGLYHADVAQEDLPQGTTIMVARSIRRDDPDAIPLAVMNQILGGGGFTSRITNRVRSDEGLAYAAATYLQPQVYFPGTFIAFFQSKNRTVALAAAIILEEIERIRVEDVSAEELAVAKNAFIERLPQRFASKRAMLGVFVNDELTSRAPGFWSTYRDRVRRVTAADVRRVADAHVHPDHLAMLVVGDWDEIYGGDVDGRATMNDLFGGNVRHLPMRDPLTLEPLEP